MIPLHLQLYDETYFAHGKQAGISGYTDYARCRELLFEWCKVVEEVLEPKSVLDVGAAYGFVPEYFGRYGVEAAGVEPSEYARQHSRVPLLAGALPTLPIPRGRRYDTVLCTEVLEHIPEDLIAASMRELSRVTDRALLLLVMLEGPQAHDDAGHICLHERGWWEERLNATGMTADRNVEAWLNSHPLAARAGWTGRLFLRGWA